MGKALYRKYRSKSLSDVIGQTHITDILTRSISKGKIAHAYLFTGPRGVGKTSVARILAHEINGLKYDESTNHPDIIEIDAASNRRIDDIRDLRDKVQIAPASAKYKVYIIDEVHMLTGESFNAFLKTLEEPPAHVIFILATTDAHKLPVTITSRTQRFTFRSISPADATSHLKTIASSEKILIDDDALDLIVEHGDGSFRDSISLLDQLSSLSEPKKPISRTLVENVLGLAAGDSINSLLGAYMSADRSQIISILSQLEQSGVSPTVVANQLMRLIRQQLDTKPQLVNLFEDLVAVLSSPRADARLLVALLPPASVSPIKLASAAVSAGPVAVELKSLEKEAIKSRPSETRVRQKVETEAKPEVEVAPNTTEQEVSDNSEAAADSDEPAETPDAPVEAKSPIKLDENFSWEAFTDQMKQSSVAIASILAKCKGESDGSTLTIFTGTAFWKKKLDDVKYQPALHDGLSAIGFSGLNIETVPTTMPPKDSQAAAVAAIMGGGEEVQL